MGDGMIEVETRGDVRVVWLSRAEKRNALLPGMLTALREAIESSSEARAVALVGRGKVFCAGFDLKACAGDASGETMRALLTGLSGCVSAMRSCPAPVVVGAHGAAVAGGCALLGGADVVVADRGAKLGYPVTRIGVSPVVSAPFMLASLRAGVVRSRLVDPELVDGARALELGMVHELVEEPGRVSERAIVVAQSLASKPGSGCRETKAWLNTIAALSGERIERGLDGSLSLAGGDEERERLEALWG